MDHENYHLTVEFKWGTNPGETTINMRGRAASCCTVLVLMAPCAALPRNRSSVRSSRVEPVICSAITARPVDGCPEWHRGQRRGEGQSGQRPDLAPVARLRNLLPQSRAPADHGAVVILLSRNVRLGWVTGRPAGWLSFFGFRLPCPFRANVDIWIANPGRCPGLSYCRPSGGRACGIPGGNSPPYFSAFSARARNFSFLSFNSASRCGSFRSPGLIRPCSRASMSTAVRASVRNRPSMACLRL